MESENKRKKNYKYPFEITDFTEDIYKKVGLPRIPQLRGVFVGPKNYSLSISYKDVAADIYNFEARSDDVYLMGYPRSGTTLHAEMVWLIGNNLDYEAAANEVIDIRFPAIDAESNAGFMISKPELERRANDENLRNITQKCFQLNIKDLPQRRFIKSHLPISLNPPHIFEVGAKVIYCARNPKDVAVSMYHILRSLFKDAFENSFELFFRCFKSGFVPYTPFFEYVKEAWEKRNDENFLILFYEDTIKDKKQTIRRVAKFLNKNLTENQIENLEEHLSIEKFRKNKSVNQEHSTKMGVFSEKDPFIRKGKPGGWRDYFKGDLEQEVDEWIEEALKGTDLKFSYD